MKRDNVKMRSYLIGYFEANFENLENFEDFRSFQNHYKNFLVRTSICDIFRMKYIWCRESDKSFIYFLGPKVNVYALWPHQPGSLGKA